METAAEWRHNELSCRSRSAKGADHRMQAGEHPTAEAGHPAALVTERLHLLRAYRHAWDGRAAEEISPWLERCWRATSSYVNPILDSVRGPQDLTQGKNSVIPGRACPSARAAGDGSGSGWGSSGGFSLAG